MTQAAAQCAIDRPTINPPTVGSGDDRDPTLKSRFDADGYAVLDGMTTTTEVDATRAVFEKLFEQRRGWDNGDFFDFTAADDTKGALTLPQMFWPSRYEPQLRETLYHRRALAAAQQILGAGAELVWEFAMLKPAGTGGATPWHQDESFFGKGTPYDTAISIWMPLQDVDLRNGCLAFVPGSNHGPLFNHTHVDGDPRTHGLMAEVTDADVAAKVDCPLRVGQATVHHSRTLHSAGPNRSETPRHAWILEFAVTDPAKALKDEFRWNAEKNTARAARARRALPWTARLLGDARRILTGRGRT